MLMLVIELTSKHAKHEHIDESTDTGEGEVVDSWTGLLQNPDFQVILKISAAVA